MGCDAGNSNIFWSNKMTIEVDETTVDYGNPVEVLGLCLLKTTNLFIELAGDGINRDAYREVSKTVKVLAKTLESLQFSNEFADEGDGDPDPDGEESDEMEKFYGHEEEET